MSKLERSPSLTQPSEQLPVVLTGQPHVVSGANLHLSIVRSQGVQSFDQQGFRQFFLQSFFDEIS
jgi:hypothetical protein